MNPIRLYTASEKQKVKTLLVQFYSNKPVEYGFYDERNEEYQKYADFIKHYTPQGGKHLELGCGGWQLPQTIAERGFEEVVGCDFFSDNNLYDYQSKLTSYNAKLVQYDGITIPYPDNYFDSVSSFCVAEHLVDVEEVLNQMNRVLKPNGIFMIKCPNWSGLNNAVKALYYLIVKKHRYWHYETMLDGIGGVFRSFGWYLQATFSSGPTWILVYPRLIDGKINFESGDDDVVHLCQPASFKKYFKQHGYTMTLFNRGMGESKFAKSFNSLFPAFATTINIVAIKK